MDSLDAPDDIAALYQTNRRLLLGIATHKFWVPSDDAEALVHDVFLTLIRRWHLVRDVHAWLIGAVCHASRHYWRNEEDAGGICFARRRNDTGNDTRRQMAK